MLRWIQQPAGEGGGSGTDTEARTQAAAALDAANAAATAAAAAATAAANAAAAIPSENVIKDTVAEMSTGWTYNGTTRELTLPAAGASFATDADTGARYVTNPVTQAIEQIAAPDLMTPETALTPVMRAFFAAPFAQRAMLVCSGSLPGTRYIDLSQAVIPATNDLAGLNAAMTTANALNIEFKVVLIQEDITVSGNVTVTSFVRLVSNNGSKIIHASGAYLLLNDFSQLIGLDLVRMDVRLAGTTTTAYGTSNGHVGGRVIGCRLGTASHTPSGSSLGQICLTAPTYGPCLWAECLWNEINCANPGGGSYGIVFSGGANNYIAWNKVYGTWGTSRLMFGDRCGGERNVFEHNWLSGGLTGWSNLIRRDFAPGGGGTSGGYINDCVVRYNFIENIAEEGMSIDANANSSTQTAGHDRCVVTATSGTPSSSPAIYVTRAGTSGISKNMSVVALSGSAIGKSIQISDINPDTGPSGAETGTLQILLVPNTMSQADLTGMAAGGVYVSIQIQAYRNKFYRNFLKDVEESPMTIYGLGYRNEIVGNVNYKSGYEEDEGFNQAMLVISLAGITASDTNGANRTSTVCAVSYNYVYGNWTLSEISANVTPVIFDTASYGSNPDAYLGPMPQFVGGNQQPVSIRKIRSTTSAWTSTVDSCAVTDSGEAGTTSMHASWHLTGGLLARQDHIPAILNPHYRQRRSLSGNNGSVTVFSYPHGLKVAPRFYWCQPQDSIAAGGNPVVTVDQTNVTITYGTAPASGTARWSIHAEVGY